ncbi:uncharacterized protein LOC112087776 [Eutrema salsugineum]|uniref:uncharacterized protein LOC112087776 n=1 Tax=Eutrema salsugineum TaxID=72664 RepID=UPI000CECE97E|nr:uncharacterized protein LOC112087776 [Eutrema salsugineum]
MEKWVMDEHPRRPVNKQIFYDLELKILQLVQLPAPVSGSSWDLYSNVAFLLDAMDDSTLGKEIQNSLPWVLWHIWKNRNSILFANQQEATVVIVHRSQEEADLWNKLNAPIETEDRNRNLTGLVDSLWHPPLVGIAKCNMNAN